MFGIDLEDGRGAAKAGFERLQHGGLHLTPAAPVRVEANENGIPASITAALKVAARSSRGIAVPRARGPKGRDGRRDGGQAASGTDVVPR